MNIVNNKSNKFFSKKELEQYQQYILPLEDLSNQKNILPTLKEIKQRGYSGIEPLKSDYSRLIHDKERTKDFSYLCKREMRFSITKKGLMVLTFNVHSWVSVCNPTDDGKHRNFQGFYDFFKKYDADILCLQEVKPIKRKVLVDQIKISEIKKDFNYEYLNMKMKKLGYNYSFIVDGAPGIIESGKYDYFAAHNAIYSKYPIQNPSGFSLPGNRSFMVCDIEDFTIVNFHGEVRKSKTNFQLEKNGLNPKGPYDSILKLQINLILLYLAYYHSTSNIVFAGDFNYPYETILKYKKYKRFDKPTPEEVYEQLFLFFKDTTKYDIQKRITNFSSFTSTDFIFVNKELREKYKYKGSVIYTDISDHFPVYCDIYKVKTE